LLTFDKEKKSLPYCYFRDKILIDNKYIDSLFEMGMPVSNKLVFIML
jgi:hypothetical protein